LSPSRTVVRCRVQYPCSPCFSLDYPSIADLIIFTVRNLIRRHPTINDKGLPTRFTPYQRRPPSFLSRILENPSSAFADILWSTTRPRLSRGYATTVAQGRHSTRLVLSLRVPSSRVQIYPVTAVGQSRMPTRDRGITIAYCSRGSASVVYSIRRKGSNESSKLQRGIKIVVVVAIENLENSELFVP
jgi:hypothetical protein